MVERDNRQERRPKLLFGKSIGLVDDRANSSRSAGSPAAAARIMVQQVDSEVGTVFLAQAQTRCRPLFGPGGAEFKTQEDYDSDED